MKPSYSGYEAKPNNGGYLTLPPVGAYVAEIQEVRVVEQFDHNVIEMMMEITEGEYKGRFQEAEGLRLRMVRFCRSLPCRGPF